MAYRTHCDWCGAWLARDADYAEMSGTIHHRKGKSALDAKWAEETCITRHFCACRERTLTAADATAPDSFPRTASTGATTGLSRPSRGPS
jgi:hypothetical protein